MQSVLNMPSRMAESISNIPVREIGYNIAYIGCAVLIFAGLTAATGAGLQMAGERLAPLGNEAAQSLAGNVAQAVAPYLNTVGGFMLEVGRYAFLSVSVPAYYTFYEAPKWLLTEGLPIVGRHSYNYILLPVYNSVVYVIDNAVIPMFNKLGETFSQVCDWAFANVVNPLINRVLNPIWGGIDRLSIGQWIISLFLFAITISHLFTKLILDYVIPFFAWTIEGISNIWNMIEPTLNALYTMTTDFITQITSLFNGRCLPWILDNIIFPTFDAAAWVGRTIHSTRCQFCL